MGNGSSFLICSEDNRRGTASTVEDSAGKSKASTRPSDELEGSGALLDHVKLVGAPVIDVRPVKRSAMGPGNFGGLVEGKDIVPPHSGPRVERVDFRALGDTSFLDEFIAEIRSGRHTANHEGDAPVEDAEQNGERSGSRTPKTPDGWHSQGKTPSLPPPGSFSKETLELEERDHVQLPSLFSRPGSEDVTEDDNAEPKIGMLRSSASGRGGTLLLPLGLPADPLLVREQSQPSPKSLVPASPRKDDLPAIGDLGSRRPGTEERRWIEAAVRRMFSLLAPSALESLIESFREWKLPKGVVIVKQSTPISTGPGLCVLLEGVVDVMHCPKGAKESDKVCTYDRCGQCFGELELFCDGSSQMTPRTSGRKLHWATVGTRTPVTLWIVDRKALQQTSMQKENLVNNR